MTTQPISEFLDKISYLNPDEIQQKGIDTFCDEIEEAYDAFTQYVWDKVPHDEEESVPTVFVAACGGPDFKVQEEVNDALETLEALEVSDVFSGGDRSTSSIHKINKPLEDILAAFPVDELNEVARNQVMQAAIELCQEYAIKMNAFLGKVAEICANSEAIDKVVLTQQPQEIQAFFSKVFYEKEQLEEICKALVKKHWLDRTTDINDFVYFFSGEGAQPQQRLKWTETTVLLAIFLHKITEDRRLWKKASKIFLCQSREDDMFYPVNSDRIRLGYSSAQVTEKYSENCKAVDAILAIS